MDRPVSFLHQVDRLFERQSSVCNNTAGINDTSEHSAIQFFRARVKTDIDDETASISPLVLTANDLTDHGPVYSKECA